MTIASKIASRLKKEAAMLKRKNKVAHLAVILVGNDKSSHTYVSQKQKWAQKIGIKVSLFKFPSINTSQLSQLIEKLNSDTTVHGVIIQRPVPLEIESSKLNNMVAAVKDVDGFNPDSFFDPPVSLAVMEILKNIHQDLRKKRVLVIGRGETAGKPIAKYLSKIKVNFTIAHSQTKDLVNLCRASDIIISCVGRPNIVRHDMVTKNSVIIGVGLHAENGKLKPDYDQEDIGKKAAFYTPVPGGVGPVNVAMLLNNTVNAASRGTYGGFP